MEKWKFKPIPADFADRFPDGDYTVGRGADPRGAIARSAPKSAKRKPAAKRPRTKKAPRAAAAE